MVRAGDVIDQHLGRRLRELRENAGLSRKVLAEQLNMTHQQIAKYESGTNRIAVGTLLRLAPIVGAHVSAFYEGLPGCTLGEKASGRITELVETDAMSIEGLPPLIQRKVADLIVAIARLYGVKSC